MQYLPDIGSLRSILQIEMERHFDASAAARV